MIVFTLLVEINSQNTKKYFLSTLWQASVGIDRNSQVIEESNFARDLKKYGKPRENLQLIGRGIFLLAEI